MELLNLYVKRLLDSWTALRLGLNHESGGPNTHRKCEDEISDFLEDYLDEELNIMVLIHAVLSTDFKPLSRQRRSYSDLS
ncbi:unnamed protein product [Heterobilharzia americana]|nr:unnamed protein product [Heterobilharzia americana]